MNSPRAMTMFMLAVAGLLLVARVSAEEINLGNHSKDEIKTACNAAGGDLLGVSDSGSYGCENSKKGTMILCNKNGNCTGYVPARTRAARNTVLNSFGLKVHPVVAEASCCTGVSIDSKCVEEPKSGGCPADHPIRVIKP